MRGRAAVATLSWLRLKSKLKNCPFQLEDFARSGVFTLNAQAASRSRGYLLLYDAAAQEAELTDAIEVDVKHRRYVQREQLREQ